MAASRAIRHMKGLAAAWALAPLALAATASPSMSDSSSGAETHDFVVVGGTPGGIACAVAAARQGLDVLLVNGTPHLGGFMTSGCGGWEAPYDGDRSPVYDEVRRRIADYYRATYGADSPQYRAAIPDPATRSRFGRPKVEPRVCEKVFEDLIAAEPKLKVLRGFDVASAKRDGARLESIELKERNGERRLTVAASAFADATYEGDLAAAAKVPYRVGRESRDEYGEPHAGILFAHIKAADPARPPAPAPFNLRDVGETQRNNGIEILMPESTGEADPAVMCYNYRLILTKDPANRLPVPKPENYDPSGFEAAGRNFLPGLPNDKIAWNGAGRLIGAQIDYPEADWPAREKIARRHLDAALGWLWYIQNDPAARPEEREFWKDYGLPKDEFPDNGHVPYEIYVREARRIVGRYVFTEHDGTAASGIDRAPLHADSIAITDWPFDSTACTTRTARGEQDGKCMASDVWRPAQVPYRSLLPRGVDNLLVPVCLSASHVGWGTIRLEPVWMQTGEAAGLAAALALRAGTTPAALDPERFARYLAGHRYLVAFFNDVDISPGQPWTPGLQYFGARGFFGGYDAKPDQPLSPARAARWLETFGKLAAADPAFDPTAEARLLPAEASETGAPVTVGAFAAQAKLALQARHLDGGTVETALRAQGLDPAAALTRGQACGLLFAALPPAVTP